MWWLCGAGKWCLLLLVGFFPRNSLFQILIGRILAACWRGFWLSVLASIPFVETNRLKPVLLVCVSENSAFGVLFFIAIGLILRREK
jgi:formate-dependent nitrite reductase membrane component NrfD